MFQKKKGTPFRENYIVVSCAGWVGMFDFKANILAQMQVDEKKLEEMREKRRQEEEEE
jgi:hypothetical protein